MFDFQKFEAIPKVLRHIMVILEISRTIFNILIVLGDIFVRKVTLAYLKFSVITLTSPRMQTIYNELPRTIEKEEEEEEDSNKE